MTIFNYRYLPTRNYNNPFTVLVENPLQYLQTTVYLIEYLHADGAGARQHVDVVVAVDVAAVWNKISYRLLLSQHTNALQYYVFLD